MTTFFPHLYEYCRIKNLLIESEAKPTDNELQIKKRKRLSDDDDCYPNVPTLKNCYLTFDQYHQSKDIDFLKYLEIKAQKLRESNYNPLKFYDVTVGTVLKARTELSNITNYQKPTEWPLSYEMLMEAKANEVRHWVVVDAIICIEIAKTLPFFTTLIAKDQQALLKSITLLNTALTEIFYSFEASSDILIFPDGFAPSVLKASLDTHHNMFQGVMEPLKRIQMTKEEYILLKTIIFCSSKSETISDNGKKILESEYHKYSSLLLNHVQAKWGDAAGAVRYSQILSVMEAMIYFTQKAKQLYIFYSTIKQSPPHPTLTILDEITI